MLQSFCAFFPEIPCLEVAAQSCMERIPVSKKGTGFYGFSFFGAQVFQDLGPSAGPGFRSSPRKYTLRLIK